MPPVEIWAAPGSRLGSDQGLRLFTNNEAVVPGGEIITRWKSATELKPRSQTTRQIKCFG